MDRLLNWTTHRGVLPLAVLLLGTWLLVAACSEEPPSDSAESSPRMSSDSVVRFLDPPAGPGAMAPNLTPSTDGALLSWLEPVGEGHALYLAELRGEDWSEPRQIATGDAFFANWADLPAVAQAVNPGGALYAHWLSKLGDDTYAYGAELAVSKDEGKTWQELGLLHDDASPTEHGFVSYAPLPDGDLQAFWLDGRQMPGGGGMQLRTAVLDESAPPPSTILDDQVCECCATDAALTSEGPIVVYRDRSEGEIRDIAIVRATGEGWSEPTLIHDDGWKINGCPVNGPAVAADGDRVAVAWFSGGEPQARVSTAFSSDGGATFTEAFLVDDQEPLGRVDVALGAQDRAYVSWLASTQKGAEIRWRRILRDGTADPFHVVAPTSAVRSSGMPRMIRRGNDLLFAWIEGTEPSRLRAGIAPLP